MQSNQNPELSVTVATEATQMYQAIGSHSTGAWNAEELQGEAAGAAQKDGVETAQPVLDVVGWWL
jgi:hypothetical protein